MSKIKTVELRIARPNPNRVIIEVTRGGRTYEVDVRIDDEEDGGISADINENGIELNSATLEWNH